MTSKNSFLVSLKENNKRRLWVWVMSALIFVLGLPILLSIAMSQIHYYARNLNQVYTAAVAAEILHERLVDGAIGQLGFSTVRFLLTVPLALVSGIQGFSYLYGRKKIDFYMGMPVARSRRYLTIWLNGILIYILPRLLGLAVGILIAVGNGAMEGRVLYSALMALMVDICVYLCIYHMAILAVMLTGNIVITGFGFLVFCLYELAVRTMISSYKGMFFRYMSYYSRDSTPLLSPFVMYFKLEDAFNYRDILDIKYLLGLIGFALALGIVSYLCYLLRPAEAAGKAMTFGVTRAVIKILIVVPASLMAGLLMAELINFSPRNSMDGIGYVIFAIVLAVVLGSGLIQVIYEFDIKGAFHGKLHIVISGVLVALIFVVFRYDLLGYDSYVPDAGQIESAAFIPQGYEEIRGSSRFDSEGNYLSAYDYAEQYMYLENGEDVCELAAISMEAYNRIMNMSEEERSGYESESEDRWTFANIIYRLKNGRKVYRQIWVNMEDAESAGLLDRIIGSDEFKKGYVPGASQNLAELVAENDARYKIAAAYGNTVYSQNMSEADTAEFLALYQKELSKANFTNVRENVAVGIFSISIMEELPEKGVISGEYSRSTRYWDVGMNIYPFYDECIAWLREHGYYREQQLNLEDVDHIQIVNDNTAVREKLRRQQMPETDLRVNQYPTTEAAAYSDIYADTDIDTRMYADYTDEEELKKIAESIYPYDMTERTWDAGIRRDEDFAVYVYFKAESPMTRNFGTTASYSFLEGQVPDFVREDTAYKEK